MNTQQNYLETTESSLSLLSPYAGILEKRLKQPTLRSCKYKPEAYAKSMVKFDGYRQKLCICILLLAKFYLERVKNARFNLGQPQRFSVTNLHGVFSGGLFLDEVSVPKYENGTKTFETIKLKRPKHHNYSDEVNFIVDQFLILEHKSSLQNGPALWRFQELDLDDVILVELESLVEEYSAELNELISVFHNARFQEQTEVNPRFVDDGDLEFLIDVVGIWCK